MTHVTLCSVCEGSGEVLVRGGRGESDGREQCEKCLGSGRTCEIFFSCTVPFNPSSIKNFEDNYDTKIHELLRKGVAKYFTNERT